MITSHEKNYQRVLNILEELCSDQSIEPEDMVDLLQFMREELDVRIEAFSKDTHSNSWEHIP